MEMYVWRDLMWALGLMIIISELSQLSCREFACIQVVRQFSNVHRVALVIVLVEM